MIVKDLVDKLLNMDQKAIIMLYEGGEIYGAKNVEPGRVISGRTYPGPDFKPDNVSDEDYFDGFEKDLASIEYKSVLIS